MRVRGARARRTGKKAARAAIAEPGGGEGKKKKKSLIPLFRSLLRRLLLYRCAPRIGARRSRGLIYRRVNGLIRGVNPPACAVPVEKFVRARAALYACDIIDTLAAGRVLYPGTRWAPNSGRDINVHPGHSTFSFPMKSITDI